MYKYITILTSLLLSPTIIVAQGGRVLLQNGLNNDSPNAIVNVKWYSQSLTYSGGVNLYRRAVGEQLWVKLNDTPIIAQRTVPPGLSQVDEDLEAFLDMARDLSQISNNGFMLLNLFVKSFQSQDFSKLIGIQFDDTNVEWGIAYEYKVMRLIGRNETEMGVSQVTKVGNYQPLAMVKNFEAILEEKIVKMKWQPEEERFYGVNVYRSSSRDTSLIKLNKTPIVLSESSGNAPESDAMFQDASLEEGFTYYYQLTGLDFFGGETEKTKKVAVEVLDFTPPPAPFNITKSVKSQAVIIGWTTPGSGDVVGFNIYRSNKSDGPFEKINKIALAVNESTYTESTAIGFYYYYVAAVDLAGNEGQSNPILVEVQDTTPPAPPAFVIAKSDTGRVLLSWNRNKEADLGGYHIFRKIGIDDQTDFLLVNSLAISDTTYTQLLPKNSSNSFSFRIVAVDTSYNKSLPSATVTVQLPDVTPPIKPFIKSVNQVGDSLLIEWLANPEPDLAGYELYRFTGDSQEGVRLNSFELINNFVDTVSISGRFRYQLVAVDKAGNESAPSEFFGFEKVSNIKLGFSEVEGNYLKRKKSIQIKWKPQTLTGVNGYVVFMKNEASEIWRPVSGLQTELVFEEKNVSPKSKYQYQVRAYANDGNVAVSSPVVINTGRE